MKGLHDNPHESPMILDSIRGMISNSAADCSDDELRAIVEEVAEGGPHRKILMEDSLESIRMIAGVIRRTSGSGAPSGEMPRPRERHQDPEPANKTAKPASKERERLLKETWGLIYEEVTELLRHHLEGVMENPKQSPVIVNPIQAHLRSLVEDMTDSELGAFARDVERVEGIREELLAELETSIIFSAGVLRMELGL